MMQFVREDNVRKPVNETLDFADGDALVGTCLLLMLLCLGWH